MPNWVLNHVKFGTDKVLKDCIKEESGRTFFDFNKIIPMPSVLDDENKDAFDKMTVEEKLLFLKENDNCDNWYDWRIHFWGTKWNANDTSVINDYEVEFQTAWSMPEPILEEISKKYHTVVDVSYADEGIVENSGIVIYEDGVEIEYIPGDQKFYDDFWGWNSED